VAVTANLRSDLLALIDDEQRVNDGESALDQHAADLSYHPAHRPDVVVYPESAAEVAAVASEQLHHRCRLAERASAFERLVVVDRIDQPDPVTGNDRVRRALHEARLRRDPPDREVELVDESHEPTVATSCGFGA